MIQDTSPNLQNANIFHNKIWAHSSRGKREATDDEQSNPNDASLKGKSNHYDIPKICIVWSPQYIGTWMTLVFHEHMASQRLETRPTVLGSSFFDHKTPGDGFYRSNKINKPGDRDGCWKENVGWKLRFLRSALGNHRQFKSLVRLFTRETSCVAFLRHVIKAIMVRHLVTCHVIYWQ